VAEQARWIVISSDVAIVLRREVIGRASSCGDPWLSRASHGHGDRPGGSRCLARWKNKPIGVRFLREPRINRRGKSGIPQGVRPIIGCPWERRLAQPEQDRALELLEKARAGDEFKGPIRLDEVRRETLLDPLRADHRFQLLMKGLGFPDDPFGP
jgi:hypothetical protein